MSLVSAPQAGASRRDLSICHLDDACDNIARVIFHALVLSRMVEELGEKLAGKAFVVTCMVDRICTGREVIGNDIKVSTEPYTGEVRQRPEQVTTLLSWL